MNESNLLKPLVIDLNNNEGLSLRKEAAEYVDLNPNTTGAERGSLKQQKIGLLAEMAIRHNLGMDIQPPEEQLVDYDVLLKQDIKLDVKCRSGEKPFLEEYPGKDGIPREAKHNIFARQLYDENLNPDIFLMTHLETPNKAELPGTRRQRKWKLYVCGWISKERALKEGVYLPRHSITERGQSYFAYRGQEIELYNHNLNGLNEIKDLENIGQKDVEADKNSVGRPNLTSVDMMRIAYDLVGRDVLSKDVLEFLSNETKMAKDALPILHPNQYFHLLKWLLEKEVITNKEIEALKKIFEEEEFEGI